MWVWSTVENVNLIVSEPSSGLQINQIIGPDEMHPRVLRDLTNVIARPLSSLNDQNSQGRFVTIGNRQIKCHLSKRTKRRIWEAVSLTLVPGKVVEQILLKATSKHVKDGKVTVNSQHGVTKGKLCLLQ